MAPSLENQAVDLAAGKLKLGIPFREAVGQAARATGLTWAEVQQAMTRRSVAARTARKLRQLQGQPQLPFD